jgi:DNA-binding NtrC family response regulator
MPPSRAARPTVLVVDDEPGVRASVRLVLEDECDVLEAADGLTAVETIRTRDVDLCLLDIRLPGMEGIEVLDRVKHLDPSLEVVLVSAVASVRTAVDAMKRGAHDYLTKPFTLDELRVVVMRALERRALQREVRYLRDELARHQGPDHLVGSSVVMQRLYDVIRQVSGTSVTVLITGESGTGKELVARAIHRQGGRRDRPFLPVNCGAISPELVESELFGHERGSFTGAHARKLGKFEIAHTGTLLLDEVATLRIDLQPKLLRALQAREIERVGGTRSIPVDVRVMAATNVDLRRAVAAGQFREDLYYRLNVVPITVPPLRDRREDIPALTAHFLAKHAARFGKPVTEISPGALQLLQRYDWPGNIRELENVVERAVALSREGAIQLGDLPVDLALEPGMAARKERLLFREARQEFERQLILRALDEAGGNQTAAARSLGLHRNTLLVKMAQLGLRTGNGQARPAPDRGEEAV